MKVLIFSMTCGEGHNIVAKSLADYFEQKGIENKVVQIFGYDEKRVIRENKNFLMLCKHFPNSYDLIWNILRKKTRKGEGLPYYSKPCFNHMKKTIEEYNPDVIICTHFYASSVISYMKRNNMLNPHIITSVILTDFCLAPYWEQSKDVDYIFEPLDNTTSALLNKGYKPEQIKPLGFPIRPIFAEVVKKNCEEVRKSLNILDKFTLLIVGGGNGLGNTLKLLQSVLKKQLDINIVVINGKNKKNFEKIQNYINKNKITNVYNLGFVTNMADYMYSADVIITRCGGGSISEILAIQKPFIIREKMIINEKINKKYFIKEGCALGLNKITDAGDRVEKLLKNPSLYKSMVENIKRFSYPNATNDIVEFLINERKNKKSG